MRKIVYFLVFALIGAVLFGGGCVSDSESLSVTGKVSPGINGFGLEGLVYQGEINVTNIGNRPVEFQKVVGGFYVGKEDIQVFSIPSIIPPGKSMTFIFESESFLALRRASENSGNNIKFSFRIIKDDKPLGGKTYTADVPDMSKVITVNSKQQLPLNFT